VCQEYDLQLGSEVYDGNMPENSNKESVGGDVWRMGIRTMDFPINIAFLEGSMCLYNAQIQITLLKGLCHEMNDFVEGPKSQVSTFCTCADGIKIFFGALLWRKWKLKFLLNSTKTLTNFADPY
jgi:hypothetical protein